MPYYIRDPKRDHNFDNHSYRPLHLPGAPIKPALGKPASAARSRCQPRLADASKLGPWLRRDGESEGGEREIDREIERDRER